MFLLLAKLFQKFSNGTGIFKVPPVIRILINLNYKRIFFFVICLLFIGEPGKPLIQSVKSPVEVLQEKWNSNGIIPNLRPNTNYYITKVIIPALSRYVLKRSPFFLSLWGYWIILIIYINSE